jgi:hypothetical protein
MDDQHRRLPFHFGEWFVEPLLRSAIRRDGSDQRACKRPLVWIYSGMLKMLKRCWLPRLRADLGIVRLIVALGVLFISTSCAWLGKLERVQSLESPDGALVADFYRFGGGGALGNDATCVRLRLATEPFRMKSDYVFGTDDWSIVQMKWIGKRELQINYSFRVLPMRAERSWRDVAISYVVRSDPPF